MATKAYWWRKNPPRGYTPRRETEPNPYGGTQSKFWSTIGDEDRIPCSVEDACDILEQAPMYNGKVSSPESEAPHVGSEWNGDVRNTLAWLRAILYLAIQGIKSDEDLTKPKEKIRRLEQIMRWLTTMVMQYHNAAAKNGWFSMLTKLYLAFRFGHLVWSNSWKDRTNPSKKDLFRHGFSGMRYQWYENFSEEEVRATPWLHYQMHEDGEKETSEVYVSTEEYLHHMASRIYGPNFIKHEGDLKKMGVKPQPYNDGDHDPWLGIDDGFNLLFMPVYEAQVGSDGIYPLIPHTVGQEEKISSRDKVEPESMPMRWTDVHCWSCGAPNQNMFLGCNECEQRQPFFVFQDREELQDFLRQRSANRSLYGARRQKAIEDKFK